MQRLWLFVDEGRSAVRVFVNNVCSILWRDGKDIMKVGKFKDNVLAINQTFDRRIAGQQEQ